MAQKNSSIAALNRAGQSAWYDNLSKDVLTSGALKRLVEAGVSGLTSNPAIFKKAIADSQNYDASIGELKSSGLDVESICEELMIQDVGAAADLLKPVFEQTGGLDGYASIEVSPYLARDPEATVQAAGRIYRKLGRPNVMIKIPGTKECLPAIFETLKGGINVNITLLFSVESYLAVADQYLLALEARVKEGLPLQPVRSVASFFVSRVDTICEQKFEELVKKGAARAADKSIFFGKAGIANAVMAYEAFEKTCRENRFLELKERGAEVQRPLWASTGTKNPLFSPLLYVEGLSRPQTVNTMPPQTLEAVMSGQIKTRDPETGSAEFEAGKVVDAINHLGLDFSRMMDELLEQGIKLFSDAYQELLQAIEVKVQRI